MEENAHLLRASVARTTALSLHVEDSLPSIEADAGQVQQVVMNLITNAAEAIGPSPGTIVLHTGVQDCDAAYLDRSRLSEKPPAGRYVYVEVMDTGCGMEAETQQRMFDPFYSTKVTGRGLGMATVLGIMRGHGGAIMLDSEVERGTTIRVLFPGMEAAPTELAPSEIAEARGEAGPPARGPVQTVLVVDDEESVLNLASEMVELLGCSVVTAMDGMQAVEMIQQRGDEIGAVLLDLTMPRMDGVMALKEILPVRPGARVILSSGYGEQPALEDLLRAGRVGFIAKPHGLDNLQDVLTRVLADPR